MYQRGIEIRKMIGEGYPVDQICEEIARQFKISPRTVQDQYYTILKEISLVVTEDREQLRAKLMARNETIYQKAVTERNYRTALDANMAQAKLGGLFEKEDSSKELPEIIEVTERKPLKVVGQTDESE